MKMNDDKLLKRIIIIIAYTNVPAILLGYWAFPEALGWFMGSLGSAVRLIWLANDVKKTIELPEKKAKISAAKGYYFRFLALLVYAVAVVYFFHPNIVSFGLGLLAVQMAIYLNAIWERFYSE